MSLQPSKRSEEENFTPGNSITAIEIARQIIQLPDLESQIDAILHASEHLFMCNAYVWISEELSPFINNENLYKNNIHLIDFSGLMQQAINSKNTAVGFSGEVITNQLPDIVAVPFFLHNSLLGVIQLDRLNRAGFTQAELKLITDFCFQISLIIGTKIMELIQADGQKISDLWICASEINKSISSNLDLENQVNSLASLLYQKLGYRKVTIYSVIDEAHKVYSRFSMTEEGIEGPDIWLAGGNNSLILEAIELRQAISRNDIEGNSDFSTTGSKQLAEIAIPIVVAGDFYGVIELCRDSPNAFSTTERSILQSISDHFAIAIRNAKLYRNERINRKILEDIHREISSITFDKSIEEILNHILPLLYKYISYDVGILLLLDNDDSRGSEQETLGGIQSVSVNVSDQLSGKNTQINVEDLRNKIIDFAMDDETHNNYPLIAEILEAKKPIIALDNASRGLSAKLFSFEADLSVLGIPLFVDENKLGAIYLFQLQSHKFTNEILPIATIFASFSSLMIQNIISTFSTHDQAWLATLQLQTMESYQSVSSIDELNELIVKMIPDLVGANACTLYYWDEALDSFYPEISYGFDEEQQIRLDEWDVHHGTTGAFDQLLESKTPVILDTTNIDEQLAGIIFPQYNLSDDLLILFPLIVSDTMIGAMLIDFSGTKLFRDSSQKIWDDVYTSVQALAQQAATAIDNLQLVKSREEEAYISVALLQVAQAVVSLTKLDEILSLIVRITPLLVGVKRCVIYLWDEEEQILHPSNYYGFSKTEIQFEGQTIRLREFPFMTKVFETNQIVYCQLPKEYSPSDWNEIIDTEIHLIEGFSTDSDEQFSFKLDEQALREKARLLIGFPLSVKGEALGVMLVEEEDPTKGAPFHHIREKRIEIVRGITQQAALAIQNEALLNEAVNSERMERELQLAREIQETFLPHHLPQIPGWKVSIRWKPARQVAGDFYDFIRLNENQIGFVIADVADKGMPAALFMILIRTLIRSAAKDNLSPALVLRQVNELLIQDSKNGMFVTVFYAVIDLSSGEVVYVNAGHNPPVLNHSVSNTLVELTRTSMALGVFSDIEIEERQVFISPGDWIFFYTDGITEAFSIQGEMFGIDRLNKMLENFHQDLPEILLDLIDQSVHEFIEGGDLSDDLTMAAFYRN